MDDEKVKENAICKSNSKCAAPIIFPNDLLFCVIKA